MMEALHEGGDTGEGDEGKVYDLGSAADIAELCKLFNIKPGNLMLPAIRKSRAKKLAALISEADKPVKFTLPGSGPGRAASTAAPKTKTSLLCICCDILHSGAIDRLLKGLPSSTLPQDLAAFPAMKTGIFTCTASLGDLASIRAALERTHLLVKRVHSDGHAMEVFSGIRIFAYFVPAAALSVGVLAQNKATRGRGDDETTSSSNPVGVSAFTPELVSGTPPASVLSPMHNCGEGCDLAVRYASRYDDFVRYDRALLANPGFIFIHNVNISKFSGSEMKRALGARGQFNIMHTPEEAAVWCQRVQNAFEGGSTDHNQSAPALAVVDDEASVAISDSSKNAKMTEDDRILTQIITENDIQRARGWLPENPGVLTENGRVGATFRPRKIIGGSDYWFQTPLSLAVKQGNPEMVMLILKQLYTLTKREIVRSDSEPSDEYEKRLTDYYHQVLFRYISWQCDEKTEMNAMHIASAEGKAAALELLLSCFPLKEDVHVNSSRPSGPLEPFTLRDAPSNHASLEDMKARQKTIKDVALSHVDPSHERYKELMSMVGAVIHGRWFVVLRERSNGSAALGPVWCPEYQSLPADLTIRALAGPMHKEDATDFHNFWKRGPKAARQLQARAMVLDGSFRRFAGVPSENGSLNASLNTSQGSALNDSLTMNSSAVMAPLADDSLLDRLSSLSLSKDQASPQPSSPHHLPETASTHQLLLQLSANVDPAEWYALLDDRTNQPRKGWERQGRYLSKAAGVQWEEYWPFLDCFADFGTDDGIVRLESYLAAASKAVGTTPDKNPNLQKTPDGHPNSVKEAAKDPTASSAGDLEAIDRVVDDMTKLSLANSHDASRSCIFIGGMRASAWDWDAVDACSEHTEISSFLDGDEEDAFDLSTRFRERFPFVCGWLREMKLLREKSGQEDTTDRSPALTSGHQSPHSLLFRHRGPSSPLISSSHGTRPLKEATVRENDSSPISFPPPQPFSAESFASSPLRPAGPPLPSTQGTAPSESPARFLPSSAPSSPLFVSTTPPRSPKTTLAPPSPLSAQQGDMSILSPNGQPPSPVVRAPRLASSPLSVRSPKPAHGLASPYMSPRMKRLMGSSMRRSHLQRRAHRFGAYGVRRDGSAARSSSVRSPVRYSPGAPPGEHSPTTVTNSPLRSSNRKHSSDAVHGVSHAKMLSTIAVAPVVGQEALSSHLSQDPEAKSMQPSQQTGYVFVESPRKQPCAVGMPCTQTGSCGRNSLCTHSPITSPGIFNL